LCRIAAIPRWVLMSSVRAQTAGPQITRLWNRSLDRYPQNSTRFACMGIVVASTIVLYYQLYLAGGVATEILRGLHMSFSYYVIVLVVSYGGGAVASITAGLADRWGRANIVTGGIGLVGLLCLLAMPNVHSELGFIVVYSAIGFVEGIILVATPALIRDFSPQLGRASAMGFWTLGPVLGSLLVSVLVSGAGNASWESQYRTSGIVGLVVFGFAAVGLRELAPGLRDQLMVSSSDRALIEARASGLHPEETMHSPFRQMLRVDIVGSAFAISLFLLIYYLVIGFLPIYFETIFGYTQARANTLGNYFWAFDSGGLIIAGLISDRLRVRKPLMLVGALATIGFTTAFALQATHPNTGFGTFVLLLSGIAVSAAFVFAPWIASFTETVERRNPALMATGLAVWGMIFRVLIALTVFVVPKVVTSVTPLVQHGPSVEAALTSTQAVGATTIGRVDRAVAANPTIIARLQTIEARDRVLLAALASHPGVSRLLTAAQQSGRAPTTAQLASIRSVLGPQAFTELSQPKTMRDLAFLSSTAPHALGAQNLAALGHPTPQLSSALHTLATYGASVQDAAQHSPKQWRTFFLISVGGQIVFIPFIFIMAGFWDPRRARKAEEEHERGTAWELEQLEHLQALEPAVK
jgi:ACS family D-galactonate transporter-like MFS transporter